MFLHVNIYFFNLKKYGVTYLTTIFFLFLIESKLDEEIYPSKTQSYFYLHHGSQTQFHMRATFLQKRAGGLH